jgi:hypothetical protein
MRRTSTRLDLWLNAASVLSVVLTLVAVSLSYFTFSRFAGFLFNADAIQTPAVFADVFGRGGSFLSWSIAPAPAIVPEYGMFAIAYIVGVTFVGRILAYSLIQVIVLWAALYGISWAAGLRRPIVVASLTVSVMGLFCFLRVMNFSQLLQSAFHFGGFILQLVSLAMIILLWRGRFRHRRGATVALWGGIVVVALLGSLNDALYVVQLAAPVCLIVLVGVIVRRVEWKRGLLFILVVGLSSVIGWKLYAHVIPNAFGTGGRVDFESAPDDAESFVQVWGNSLSRTPIAVVLIILTIFLGLTGAYVLVRGKNLRWMSGTTLPVLAVFALLSGTLPILAALASSVGTSPRYALPLFYWPCILVAMILTQIEWRRAIVVAVVVACVASLASTTFAVRDAVRLGLQDSYYPPSVACLDDAAAKFGVTHAIGTYWIAKPTQAFSRTGLTVTVLNGQWLPRAWVATIDNVFPAYDAFIEGKGDVNDANRKKLAAKFGKPSDVINCPGSKMYVWAPGRIVLPTK